MKKSTPLILIAIVTLCILISCGNNGTTDEPHSGEFSVSDSQKVVFAIENLKNANSELFSFNHYDSISEGWRLLTGEEWKYIVLKRQNAINLVLWASIGGKKGVIFLPDNFNNSFNFSNISQKSIKPWDDQIRLIDTNTDPTAQNILTENQWTALAQQGAIFLPLNLDNEGGYWQTGDSYLSLSTTFIWPARGCNTSAMKLGVRLAMDVKK